MTEHALSCVLFDLDGTLVDTAPDLVGALNELRVERELPALPFQTLRPVASHGAAALLLAGFPDLPPEHRRELVSRYLAIYADRIARDSRLFPGMEAVLDALDGDGYRWGIVTNKPAALTRPLLEALGLLARAACVVSGDDLEQRKPHPMPVLHACERCGVEPDHALYVGDAERDVQAGRAARARTAVALWGYLDGAEDPAGWRADLYLESPGELLTHLGPSWQTGA